MFYLILYMESTDIFIQLSPTSEYTLNLKVHVKVEMWKVASVLDFLGGAADRNPLAKAGNVGLIPGLGRSHMPPSN